MIDFKKDTAISILEKNYYKYLGYLDAGWGEKFYTFEPPYCAVQGGTTYPVTYKLRDLRHRAYLLDHRNWLALTALDEKGLAAV